MNPLQDFWAKRGGERLFDMGGSTVIYGTWLILKHPCMPSKGVCINLSKSEHRFMYSPWLSLAKVKGQSNFREALELGNAHGH